MKSLILLVLTCTSVMSQDYVRICYFTNWAQYRNDPGKYTAQDIDPFLCTHIVYSFAKIVSGRLQPYEWNDIEYANYYKQVTDMKIRNPSLKVLLAVGGWNHEAFTSPFSQMVATFEGRRTFIIDAFMFECF